MQTRIFLSVGPSMGKLFPFIDAVIIAIEKPCQHDILRTAWTRILLFNIWLRIIV